MEMTLLNWVATLVGAMGGLEFVKWLFNRKSAKRTDEFHFLKETSEFLQQQIKDKEQRFAEQTQLVRQLNREIIGLERKVGELEVELVEVRCEDASCPFRLPPNAKTPPREGVTKKRYFDQRETKENENTD